MASTIEQILADLQPIEAELRRLPTDIHWFCPDRPAVPNGEGEATSPTTEQVAERREKAQRTLRLAYKYSTILGIPQDLTGDKCSWYADRLDGQLITCYTCILAWHKGRKQHLKNLAETFDEQLVEDLAQLLNDRDAHRINEGLRLARTALEDTPVRSRSFVTLVQAGTQAMLGLFEALCSSAYLAKHGDSELFRWVFDNCQQSKPLKVQDFTPAVGRFLFDADPTRLRFAHAAWKKVPVLDTHEMFDWVLHDALTDAIQEARQSAEIPTLERFWAGVNIMLTKLDKSLVRECLRSMEVQPSLYRLALDHCRCVSEEILASIIRSLHLLLGMSKEDFWADFSGIPSSQVFEQIFNSPSFVPLLGATAHASSDQLAEYLAWTVDAAVSLPSAQQYNLTRSLCESLLARFQTTELPHNIRSSCLLAGLRVLKSALQTFVARTYQIDPTISLIVVDDMMSLVHGHIDVIMRNIAHRDRHSIEEAAQKEALEVLGNGLSLDCKAFAAEFAALQDNKIPQTSTRIHKQAIWDVILRSVHPGTVPLARAILVSTCYTIGIDTFYPSRRGNEIPTEVSTQYNSNFEQITQSICQVHERLSDFDASDLLDMYRDPVMSRPMFGAFHTSHQNIFEAAIQVAKTATGQMSRAETIATLLEQAFNPMLVSIVNAINRILRGGPAYGPMFHAIKFNKDVLQCLTDATGFLRSHTPLSGPDRGILMAWWTQQWKALDSLFHNFEDWSTRMNRPMDELKVHLRDCMEYAKTLLDQYTVVAAALSTPIVIDVDSPDATKQDKDAKDKRKEVLSVVRAHVFGLIKMIRLKDERLIQVITELLVQLLRLLADHGLEVGKDSADYMKRAIQSPNDPNYMRNNLSPQEKAALTRAFEEHWGELVNDVTIVAARTIKQSTIDAFARSVGVQKPRDHSTLASRPHDGKAHDIASKFRGVPPVKTSVSTADAEAFKERRRKELEEKKARNAKAVAEQKAKLNPALLRGEGSGLQGIAGVLGKDHGPVRSEIMVSSEEESDEDDVDETNTLIKTRKPMSSFGRQMDASRKLAARESGPVRKTKIQRSAKDLRARVEPSMDPLYTEILNWDLFHEGDTPPTTQKCVKIAKQFRDIELYRSTFEPLLISEVWRSLVTARDEGAGKPLQFKVNNHMITDKFIDVSARIEQVMPQLPMFEKDIILLSRHADPLNHRDEQHCLARVGKINRKRDSIEVTMQISRTVPRSMMDCLGVNAKMNAVKIMDMTTTHREYAALSSLIYYDLATEILEAKPSPIRKFTDAKIDSTMATYKLNRGQASAILSANDNDGFTLIQGPPGTGKTKTIVAMVGNLMTPVLRQQAQSQVPGRPSTAVMKKLLICAPSNAAVDELVLRLKTGIITADGKQQKLNVIRVGRSDAINHAVKDVCLEELVRIKLDGEKKDQGGQSEREKLHLEAGQVKEQLSQIRAQLETIRAQPDSMAVEMKLQNDFDHLKRRQVNLGAKIDEEKEKSANAPRDNEIKRRQYTQEIINNAHILCATLSGSGHDTLRNASVEFETVIIDEAAQCIELSALIPLKYGCLKCILVGDPEQLPPTVLSRSAQSFGYEQSLFVRMQLNSPQDIHLLDTQYRMHPEISQFPSAQFYDSRLVDGESMARDRQQPWHASRILGPYRFFDVEGVQTKEARGHSFINIPELNAAMQLYARLRADYPTVSLSGKIGIITSYKAQLHEMKARFAKRYGEEIFTEIEFNTTDAFQGREREIIIFSCVRAKASGGIGFLGDIRRMNVGLTRAKSSLWVLGDSRSLVQGEFWKRLIEDAKARDRYTGGDVLGLLKRPSEKDAQYGRNWHAAAGVNDGSRGRSDVDVVMKDVGDSVGRHDVSASGNVKVPAVDGAAVSVKRSRSIDEDADRPIKHIKHIKAHRDKNILTNNLTPTSTAHNHAQAANIKSESTSKADNDVKDPIKLESEARPPSNGQPTLQDKLDQQEAARMQSQGEPISRAPAPPPSSSSSGIGGGGPARVPGVPPPRKKVAPEDAMFIKKGARKRR